MLSGLLQGETGMNELPQIPGYRVIEKLGQGGMADVYLGVQKNLARKVAIKVLIPSLFRDTQFSKRFVKEAQTAAHLAHPNIITIHDIGKAGDSYYIVMEYLEESLSARIKRDGPLPPPEALEIVKMIAGALDYAHKKGFIHRDIKPDNIMFRADGTVVLVDFGIARAMDSSTHLTRTGMSIGTPHYMSPEQCKGEKIDGRSDIYSLGVELYELLTGDVPYKAESTAGIIIKHIQEPVPRLPKNLSGYQALIDKMMAKDREMRAQSGAELIDYINASITAREFMPPPVIETAVVTEPEIETAAGPTIRTTSPYPSTAADISTAQRGQRKKWLLPALLAAAFVIMAGTSVYFITRDPSPGIEKEKTTPQIPREDKQTPEEKKSTVTDVTDVTDDKETLKENKETPPAQTQKEVEKEKKIDTGKKDIQTGEAGAGKKDTKTKKDIPTHKPVYKPPVKEEKVQKTVKPVTLLGLDHDLRIAYNDKMRRIQIDVLNPRFQVKGQVVLNLSIDENGRVYVQDFRDMLSVIPRRGRKAIKHLIRRKINGITLDPPKNKDGQPARLLNWRVTYKVGKLGKKIFLNKRT